MTVAFQSFPHIARAIHESETYAKEKGLRLAQYGGKLGLNLIGAIASKTFQPFATMAAWVAAPVIYTWKPVNWFVNNAVTPAAEIAIETSRLNVPAPIQMLLAYLGYEKAKKSVCTNPLDLKKAAVFSAVALYASQDATARKIVTSAMTPTVLATLGACAALDYANTVAKERRLVPSMITEMASDTWKKIETVSSMVRSKPQANKAVPAA